MTYTEMKKKVLALIEEYSPNNTLLTDDPDISTKLTDVTNQIMFELSRIKRIPKYAEMDVSKGDTVDFDSISSLVGYDMYQLCNIGGARHSLKADGTVIKVEENGVLEIECYVYPDAIKPDTDADKYIFDLSNDVLEVMPYGIAADLLKSDISSEYGTIYATRYESMLQRLDPRYATASIYIEGGIDI